MILYDLVPTENDPAYQALQVSNLDRQYQFLVSVVETSIQTNRLYLSQTVIKAFNYHAIVCLHSDAGQYRPCEVTIGNHTPPMWIHVQAHMDELVNFVNRVWEQTDGILLASWVLWRLNWIHPFVNGNGRTARITAYYILCLKFGGLLPGKLQLPELLRRDRGKKDDPYVAALRTADESLKKGQLDLSEMHGLMSKLLQEQLGSVSDGTADPG